MPRIDVSRITTIRALWRAERESPLVSHPNLDPWPCKYSGIKICYKIYKFAFEGNRSKELFDLKKWSPHQKKIEKRWFIEMICSLRQTESWGRNKRHPVVGNTENFIFIISCIRWQCLHVSSTSGLGGEREGSSISERKCGEIPWRGIILSRTSV